MKKILALVLCALMTLTFGAVAEEQAPTAWHVVVDEIEITYAGQNIVLNPTLDGVVGFDGTTLWGEGSVLLNGEKALSLQGAYANDEMKITTADALDCLSMSGLLAIVNDELGASADTSLSTEDLNLYVSMMFALMDDTSWIDEAISDLSGTGLTVETRGERDYAISYAEDGVSAKVHVAWEPSTEAALDLSAKNTVVVDANAEDLPENDVVSALLAGVSKLMDDASVQQLMQLTEDVAGEIAA